MVELTTALKALAHPERLRVLVLLSQGDLSVTELVQVTGLSQPRVTQYIKTLETAGILKRMREGSWVFSRISRNNASIAAIVDSILAEVPSNDSAFRGDAKRLDELRAAKAVEARTFFDDVANDRGQLGDEYLPQADIENAMRDLVGEGRFDEHIDLGTGTARILTLFASTADRGRGIDSSPEMLRVARHRLAEAGHGHLSVRRGDLFNTMLPAESADLVTLHQVLHYLDAPSGAIHEAARLLAPGGQLLIVDYLTHSRDEFRELYNHRRLGFSHTEIEADLVRVGLALAASRVVASHERPDVCVWLATKPIASRKSA